MILLAISQVAGLVMSAQEKVNQLTICDYAEDANYVAELGVLKNIYEANVGIKISKTHNLWLDAGIMSFHIGSESAISKDY